MEKRMGRPSQGRSVRLQVTVTPKIDTWLDDQWTANDKSKSDVVFRLLSEMKEKQTMATKNVLMKWNNEEQCYYGTTSDGRQIRVAGGEMIESAQDVGVDVEELSTKSVLGGELNEFEEHLLDPDAWEACIGVNQNVEYVD